MISTSLGNYHYRLQVLFTVNPRISGNQGLINSALHNKNISGDRGGKAMTLWEAKLMPLRGDMERTNPLEGDFALSWLHFWRGAPVIFCNSKDAHL